jgi:hypothetical protein
LDLEAGAPFPGASLARFWSHPSSSPGGRADPQAAEPAISEVVPNDPLDPDPTHLLQNRRAWASLADGDWVYIQREGVAQEELFDARADARESRNLAGEAAQQPILERLRALLVRMTDGPLTAARFRP